MKHIWLKRNTKANGLIEKYKNLNLMLLNLPARDATNLFWCFSHSGLRDSEDIQLAIKMNYPF